MLPVVSARKMMSGLGGMAGVRTVLAMSRELPGAMVASTEAGVSPGRVEG